MRSNYLRFIKMLIVMGSTLGHRPVFSQETGAIKGTVLLQSTKQPVAGASVLVKGTHSGAMTDTAGSFFIDHIPAGNHTIIISTIGYQTRVVQDIMVSEGKIFDLETELLGNAATLKEVKIHAIKGENNPLMPVSAYSFSREEIFRNPGAQGDIFRAIGILPGVTSAGGQFSAISVRGQGVRDNVYLVDDIPMQEISHLEGQGAFNDPNGGRFSIFAPRTIDNAIFQGGGFSAEYGRKASAYLGLSIKEGNKETPSFSGQFDLLGATLIYDGPAYFSPNTSVFVTARYQNFYFLEKVVGLKNIGLPSYGDYMVKTVTKLNAKNKLEILAMFNPEDYKKGLGDVEQSDKVEDVSIVENTSNKALFGLHLRTLTSKKSYWKNILYYRILDNNGTFGRASPLSNPDGTFVNKVNIPVNPNLMSIKDDQLEMGYRSIFTQQISTAIATGGIELSRLSIDYIRNLNHTDTLYTFTETDIRPAQSSKYLILQPKYYNSVFKNAGYNFSAFLDFSLPLFNRLTINPSVRYDYTGFSGQYRIAPRVSGSFALTGQSSLNFAAGLYYQDPLLTDVADQAGENKLKPERTVQYIFGYKKYFSNDLKLVFETWYKDFNDLVVRPFSGESLLNNNGTGNAYGADINVTKRLSEKIYGQVGYSYMQSKRDDHDGLGIYNFTYSQPNIFSLLGSYKPNAHWVFSGKFRYATGRPKNDYVIYQNVLNNPALYRNSQEITGKNTDRLNDFISLDLRTDYRVPLKKTSVTAFIDIVDILNRYNQSDEQFQPLTGKTYFDGLGIFPSFGIRLER